MKTPSAGKWPDDAAIGAAFLSVLRDPNVAWRNTGAKPFIDRVAALTATAPQGGEEIDADTIYLGIAWRHAAASFRDDDAQAQNWADIGDKYHRGRDPEDYVPGARWLAACVAQWPSQPGEQVAPAQTPASDVLWRTDNEADQFIDEKGMVYLRYLRDLLAAASPQANRATTQEWALVPRQQLSALADLLDDNRTKTDSALAVTVPECIDVAQAAASEIREMLGAGAQPRPNKARKQAAKQTRKAWRRKPARKSQ